MTKKIQFVLRIWVTILAIFGSVVASRGQYSVDSVQAARQLKLEQLATDPESPLSSDDIQHIHHYDPDSSFRIRAHIERLHNEPTLRIPTSDGTSKAFVRYARLRFSIRGNECALTLYRSQELFVNPAYRDHLFLPFTDETNGVETYGAGRYIDLSVKDIRNGYVIIDFNQAYNPYCAYSNGYRCPVPPVENNLLIPIRAGEKTYTGPIKERPQPAPKVPAKEEHDITS